MRKGKKKEAVLKVELPESVFYFERRSDGQVHEYGVFYTPVPEDLLSKDGVCVEISTHDGGIFSIPFKPTGVCVEIPAQDWDILSILFEPTAEEVEQEIRRVFNEVYGDAKESTLLLSVYEPEVSEEDLARLRDLKRSRDLSLPDLIEAGLVDPPYLSRVYGARPVKVVLER